MKRFKKIILAFSLATTIAPLASTVMVLNNVSAQEATQTQGQRLLSLGGSLNNEEAAQTRQLLGATDVPNENIIYIDGPTINSYLNDGSTAETDVYSSAYIQQQGPGHGIQVQILTPDTIQQVSASTYQNAAITAGASNVTIRIATIYPVTGEGALAGVYALLENAGVQLNQSDIQVAQKEIEVIGNVEQNTQLTQDQINQIIAQIKKEINQYILDNGSITDEVIIEIVQRNFENIDIDETTLQEIIDLIREFAETDAAQNDDTQDQIDQSLLNRPWREVLATIEPASSVEDLLAAERPDYSDAQVYHPIIQAFLDNFYQLAEAGESAEILYSHTFVYENLSSNMSQADFQALNHIRSLIYQYTATATEEMRQASYAEAGLEYISLQDQWLMQIDAHEAMRTSDPVLFELVNRISNANGYSPKAFIYTDFTQNESEIVVHAYSDQISHISTLGHYTYNTVDQTIGMVDPSSTENIAIADTFDFASVYGVEVENQYTPVAEISADYTIPGYESPVEESTSEELPESEEESDESISEESSSETIESESLPDESAEESSEVSSEESETVEEVVE